MSALLSLLSILATTGIASASEPYYPRLFFSYSDLLDSECSRVSGYRIDPAWSDEATERTPEFQAAWDSAAPQLLGTLLKVTRRGFLRNEVTATLSVCRTTSMSNPVILNIRRYIHSFMAPEMVDPPHGFIDLTFHELLHTFVGENLNRPSALLTKYQAEDVLVRNHLHLLAIQKLVYTRLGRTDLLQWLERRYGTSRDEYGRAWEIVSRIEGDQGFVDEVSTGH